MTNTLTAAEITAMRADMADVALPDTGNVLSLTQTSDGAGGFSEAWGTVTTGVKCRIGNVGGRELLAGAAIQPFNSFWLTVLNDTTITAANRFEIGTVQYNVISADSGKSWDICRRCLVEKI
jgi:head-tail adaptor